MLDTRNVPVLPLHPADTLAYWRRIVSATDITGMAQGLPRLLLDAELLRGCQDKAPQLGVLTSADDDELEDALVRFTEQRISFVPEDTPGEEETPPGTGAAPETAEDGSDEPPDWEPDIPEPAPQDESGAAPVAIVFALAGRTPPNAVLDAEQARQAGEIKPVIWFPARLDREGHLLPPPGGEEPEIARDWLDPQPAPREGGRPPGRAIGRYADYVAARETFRAKAPFHGFAEYIGAAIRMVRDATGDPAKGIRGDAPHFIRMMVATSLKAAYAAEGGKPPYRTAWLRCFLVPKSEGAATRWLVRAYDAAAHAVAHGAPPPVLRRILGAGTATAVIDPHAPPASALRDLHCASVDKTDAGASTPEEEVRSADPLNPAQRRALHHVQAAEPEGGVLAVSGPPGTGKTAMLRAMVATQWTRAALEGGDCPITIACGATNQSVENVMGTFDGAFGRDAFTSRWLRVARERPGRAGGPSHVRRQTVPEFYAASAPSKGKRKIHKERGYVVLVPTPQDLFIAGKAYFLHDLTTEHALSMALEFGRRFEAALGLGRFPEPGVISGVFDEAARHRVETAVRQLGRIARDADKAAPGQMRDGALTQLGALQDELQGALKAVAARIATVRAALRQAFPDAGAMRRILAGEATLGRRSRWIGEKLAALGEPPFPDAGLLIEELLDVTLRVDMFHLAARLWEAEWIGTLPAPNAAPDRLRDVRRMAMLAPCIVSTLHSAPKLLHDGKTGFLFGAVDLLIIDEAGQAPPELGGAVLAFPKRAVVVGDVKQLAPVAALEAALDDRQILDRLGARSLDAMKARGATASEGSIMRLAATAASFKEPDPPPPAGGTARPRYGLLLREHYRCARTIISFCIDLLYADHDRNPDGSVLMELDPKIPDPRPGRLGDAAIHDLLGTPEERKRFREERFKGRYPLPPLGFFMTGSPNDDPVMPDDTRSWANPGEAAAMVEWLATEGRRLARWEARAKGMAGEVDLAGIVGVVTPFRGQVETLRQLVHERFRSVPEQVVDGTSLAARMTIGTVHTLQGAEKDVILFSAVNRDSRAVRFSPDAPDSMVFIDRDGGRLLNVAVSRAKKSFILFGHADLFFRPEAMAPSNDLPTALLGRHLAGVVDERAQRNGVLRKGGVRIGPQALVAVESPHKAKLIQGYLSSGHQVFATSGHIRDLARIDLKAADGFEPVWRLTRKAGTTLPGVAVRLLQASELVIATDPDAQGEAIAWHLLATLREHPWFDDIQVIRRVTFSRVSRPDIATAFAAPVRECRRGDPGFPWAALNMDLVHSALALRMIDGMLGARLSRHGFRSGRVQAPLLRLIAGELPMDEAQTDRPYAIDIVVSVRGADGRPLADAVPAKLVSLHKDRVGDLMRFKNGAPVAGGKGSALGVFEALGDDLGTIAGPCGEPAVETVAMPRACHGEQGSAPHGLGTLDVYVEAWRRHRQLPHDTAAALQALFEHGDRERPALATQPGALVELTGPDRGERLELTGAGERALAVLKEREPYFSTLAFQRAVEADIDRIALGEATYEEVVGHWGGAITGETANRVASPLGRVGPGSELPVPATVSGPEWREADPFRFPDRPAPSRGEQERAMDGNAAAPAREPAGPPRKFSAGADHPPIMPLTLSMTPSDAHVVQAFPKSLPIYALVWGQTIAVALRPPTLRIERHLFHLPRQNYGVLIETCTVEDAGWLAADADALKRLRNGYAPPHAVQALRAGAASGRVVPLGRVRRAEFLRPAPDTLLEAMATLGIGRPSTYAPHIAKLLNIHPVKGGEDASAWDGEDADDSGDEDARPG